MQKSFGCVTPLRAVISGLCSIWQVTHSSALIFSNNSVFLGSLNFFLHFELITKNENFYNKFVIINLFRELIITQFRLEDFTSGSLGEFIVELEGIGDHERWQFLSAIFS